MDNGAPVRCGYRHVLDTKLIKVSKICPKGVQNLSKTCPNAKCVQMMSKMCPSDVQKVSNFVFYVQNASKPTKWFGHNLDIFWTFFQQQKKLSKVIFDVQNMSKICPIYVQKVSNLLDTLLTYFGHIFCNQYSVQNMSIDVSKTWTHFGHNLDTFWT